MVVRAPSVPRAALSGLDAVTVDHVSDVAAVDAAVVASGTATVELAALGVPMVVVYRVHPVTHAVVRRLVRVPHLALPNLLADVPCIPEHVQVLDPEEIAADVDRVRGRPQVSASVLERFGGRGAVDRAADEVLTALQDPVR